MNFLNYKNDVLHFENVSLEEIAEVSGTPTYVYSEGVIHKNFNNLNRALEDKLGVNNDKLIAFSVKSNSNIAFINSLNKLNSGADVVSEGELKRALAAGMTGEKIVFSREDVFSLPVGSVITKSFFYSLDSIVSLSYVDRNGVEHPYEPRAAQKGIFANQHVIETRVLYRANQKWQTYSYIWDQDQREARLNVVGRKFQARGPHEGNLRSSCRGIGAVAGDVRAPHGGCAGHRHDFAVPALDPGWRDGADDPHQRVDHAIEQ